MIFNGKTLRYEEYWEDILKRLGAVEVWSGVFDLPDGTTIGYPHIQEKCSNYLKYGIAKYPLYQSDIQALDDEQRFRDATYGG